MSVIKEPSGPQNPEGQPLPQPGSGPKPSQFSKEIEMNNVVYPIPPCKRPEGHEWVDTDETIKVGNRTHVVQKCKHCPATNPPVGDQNMVTIPPMITPGGPKPLGTQL